MARAGIAVKKYALAVAIAIVLNLFINYGIATFYKEPKYEQYCNNSRYPERAVPAFYGKPFPEQLNCTELVVPTNDSSDCYSKKGNLQFLYNNSGCAYSWYCETCHVGFEDGLNKYNSNVFIFLVIIGVIAVIAGILIGVESVGTGFLLGGILSIIIGTVRNWSNLTDIIRFLLLGGILALLIVIGYKKVRD